MCGGTPGVQGVVHAHRVYPRVCGGTRGRLGRLLRNEGLSPRVRGNQPGSRAAPALCGSIPACAGEPLPSPSWSSTVTVYPRVCGGTTSLWVTPASTAGLSPRVRGNHGRKRSVNRQMRSIPACAGEPGMARLSPPALSVYPRVCGGTRPAPCRPAPQTGLSPRVRGNPCRLPFLLTCWRSIPACAGEPVPRLSRPQSGRVYPRVCGGTASV